MSTRTRHKLGSWTLAALGVVFVVAVIATNFWLRGFKIDLTENGLYTLGDGTQAVLNDISEPINLYFFFSSSSVLATSGKALMALRAAGRASALASLTDTAL